MGTGRGILPENAEPWLDFIAAHTATRAEDWRAHVVGSDQPTPLPRPLTPPQTASRRAPSAPATP